MVSPPCNCVNAKIKCIRFFFFFKLKPTYSVKKGPLSSTALKTVTLLFLMHLVGS